MSKNIPREIRLAFLTEMQRKRLPKAKNFANMWARYERLKRETYYEKMLLGLKGFMVGGKYVKRSGTNAKH